MVREDVLEYLIGAGAVPSSVSVDISGASDQLEATQQALRGNYIVALILVYLVMVAIFTHRGYPIRIMTTIPLGVAGGIAGLALMNFVGILLPMFGMAPIHQPFDMISMLGFLILLGTVVNNPILIMHRAAENYRALGYSARHECGRSGTGGGGIPPAPYRDVGDHHNLWPCTAGFHPGGGHRALSRRRCYRAVRPGRCCSGHPDFPAGGYGDGTVPDKTRG